MNDTKEVLAAYFTKLGLSGEFVDIYLVLYSFGPQTISELARNSEVERTRIYRLLDDLLETGLVEVESRYKKGVYRAAPISNLRLVIDQREQTLKSLSDELSQIEQLLPHNVPLSPSTKVLFYHGLQGNRQMLWNETRASSEIVSILSESTQVNTNSAFFERWVRRCNERNLKFRGVVGDNFIAGQQRWYATRHNEKLNNWQGRYLPADEFPITFSTIIYDEVVAYYNWKDGDIFGIEIYSADIAAAQRYFFEMLWQKAK